MRYWAFGRLLLITVAALILTVWLGPSCSDPPTASHESLSAYFPEEIGSAWTYVDSIHFTDLHDTIFDSIIGFVHDSASLVYAEFLESSSLRKSPDLSWHTRYYQRISGDTVEQYWNAVPTDTPSEKRALFILPFDSGRTWIETRVSAPRDTYTVVGAESVFVPALGTRLAVRIHRQYNILNYYLSRDYWFVKGMGVVKIENIENYGTNLSGELIAYHIPARRRGR